MKLLFLILAHDRPEQALELANTLIRAARDGVAMIHYDRRSPAGDFARLEAAAGTEPRIRLVARRVATRWGSFGLVEAPLNALAQAEAEGLEPDYVILLSGACLPCRPIAQLERFLESNAGREFIEAMDERWVTDGWRSERWRYRFWFNHRSQRPLEWAFFHVQRLLRLGRRFPDSLTPRFGSQWWALTWGTCKKILEEIRRNPRRFDFFRTVWIPDEMAIQTYVHALTESGRIAGFSLTHFQFTNYGKPVVYYDDHLDYARTLNSFFLRKAAREATALRDALLAEAAAPDDDRPLDTIGRRRRDYAVKTAAQTHYPVPGQLFYRDQQTDMDDTVLARVASPYVVVFGPPALTGCVMTHLSEATFLRLGSVFANDAVDFGEEEGSPRIALQGLRRDDVAIRDQHPALYLARARARCEKVPVLRWSPFEATALFPAVLRDPNALVVACIPLTGDEVLDKALLAATALPESARHFDLAAPTAMGLASDRAVHAIVDDLAFRAGWPAWLGPVLCFGDSGHVLGSSTVVIPWHTHGTATDKALRQERFETSLRACRHRYAQWFPSLEDGLRTAQAEIEDDPIACLAPPPRETGKLLELFGDALLTLLNPKSPPDIEPAAKRAEKQPPAILVREAKPPAGATAMR